MGKTEEYYQLRRSYKLAGHKALKWQDMQKCYSLDEAKEDVRWIKKNRPDFGKIKVFHIIRAETEIDIDRA